MIEEVKTKAIALKNKAKDTPEVVVPVVIATATIILGMYAGKRSGKKTVDRERLQLQKEMINGNIVVPLGGKDYITFPIMTDEEHRVK